MDFLSQDIVQNGWQCVTRWHGTPKVDMLQVCRAFEMETKSRSFDRANREYRMSDSNYDNTIDELVQERRNFSALAMESRLSWTNPSISSDIICVP